MSTPANPDQYFVYVKDALEYFVGKISSKYPATPSIGTDSILKEHDLDDKKKYKLKDKIAIGKLKKTIMELFSSKLTENSVAAHASTKENVLKNYKKTDGSAAGATDIVIVKITAPTEDELKKALFVIQNIHMLDTLLGTDKPVLVQKTNTELGTVINDTKDQYKLLNNIFTKYNSLLDSTIQSTYKILLYEKFIYLNGTSSTPNGTANLNLAISIEDIKSISDITGLKALQGGFNNLIGYMLLLATGLPQAEPYKKAIVTNSDAYINSGSNYATLKGKLIDFDFESKLTEFNDIIKLFDGFQISTTSGDVVVPLTKVEQVMSTQKKIILGGVVLAGTLAIGYAVYKYMGSQKQPKQGSGAKAPKISKASKSVKSSKSLKSSKYK